MKEQKRPTNGTLVSFCRAPLFLLSCFALMSLMAWIGVIPPLGDLAELLGRLLIEYGSVVAGPASFLENLAVANFVFPGSIVILAAMAATAGNPFAALLVFSMIWLGSLLGLLCSFMLGRALPGYAPSSLRGSSRQVFWQMAVSFWHPQFASMTCFSLGARQLYLRKVLPWLLVCNFGWNLFWGILTYSVGSFFSDATSIAILILVVLVVWLLFAVCRWHYICRTKAA